MAEKLKFTPETTAFLKATYSQEVTDFGGAGKVTKEFNKLFFAKMRGTEALAGFTDAQMIGSLNISGVYVPTNARVEPKKKGKTKAGLLEELQDLTDVELSSGMKLTMMDIEALIAAWPKGASWLASLTHVDVDGTPVE